MAEEKNGSLLFQLYHKYKNAKESGEKLEKEQLLQAAEESAKKAEEIKHIIPRELEYLGPIYECCQWVHGESSKDMPTVDVFLDFEQHLYHPLEEIPFFRGQKRVIRPFAEEIRLHALQLISKTEIVPEQEEDAAVESQTIPVDATVYIKLFDQNMLAVLLMLPPRDGGKRLTAEDLDLALKQQEVVYGVNLELITQIAEEGRYGQFFAVACGTLPVDGIDAKLEELIHCREPRQMKLDATGKVDYKNLDLYEEILQDQVICERIPPVEGVMGSDVCGKELRFEAGRDLVLPVGKNTVVSKDGLQLLAALSGYIHYKNHQYHVEPTLVIKENVDYSVGNINFSGDVVVNGDVCNGFTVKAEGSITVKGMVEGAHLTAGGDITIKKGMNGNRIGSLTAKGQVKSSYLENCTVYAGGLVHADSVIACDIFCDEAVCLEGARGIIIGGSITAMKYVEARMIGSKSQRETRIILGESPGVVTNKNEIQAELVEVTCVLEKLQLNIQYLDKLRGSLPPEKLAILTQITEQEALYQRRKKELQEKQQALMETGVDYSQCYVKCNMIFPVTKIKIGTSDVAIESVLSKCKVFLSESDIEVGTFS